MAVPAISQSGMWARFFGHYVRNHNFFVTLLSRTFLHLINSTKFDWIQLNRKGPFLSFKSFIAWKYHYPSITPALGAMPYASLYIFEKCDKFLKPTS